VARVVPLADADLGPEPALAFELPGCLATGDPSVGTELLDEGAGWPGMLAVPPWVGCDWVGLGWGVGAEVVVGWAGAGLLYW
jgi:hypothetical protein